MRGHVWPATGKIKACWCLVPTPTVSLRALGIGEMQQTKP
jgi:hypothetical protein